MWEWLGEIGSRGEIKRLNSAALPIYLQAKQVCDGNLWGEVSAPVRSPCWQHWRGLPGSCPDCSWDVAWWRSTGRREKASQGCPGLGQPTGGPRIWAALFCMVPTRLPSPQPFRLLSLNCVFAGRLGQQALQTSLREDPQERFLCGLRTRKTWVSPECLLSRKDSVSRIILCFHAVFPRAEGSLGAALRLGVGAKAEKEWALRPGFQLLPRVALLLSVFCIWRLHKILFEARTQWPRKRFGNHWPHNQLLLVALGVNSNPEPEWPACLFILALHQSPWPPGELHPHCSSLSPWRKLRIFQLHTTLPEMLLPQSFGWPSLHRGIS